MVANHITELKNVNKQFLKISWKWSVFVFTSSFSIFSEKINKQNSLGFHIPLKLFLPLKQQRFSEVRCKWFSQEFEWISHVQVNIVGLELFFLWKKCKKIVDKVCIQIRKCKQIPKKFANKPEPVSPEIIVTLCWSIAWIISCSKL